MMMEAFSGQLKSLRARYAEPQRAYHTFAHIEAMLGHMAEVRGRLHDPAAVELAVYYHDAVYDPQSGTNEADSAALLDADLGDALPAAILEAARAMILATVKHRIPDDCDTDLRSDRAYFLDMDLAILGAEGPDFDAYDAAIREEYAFVPDEAYRQGRHAVLSGFLARERLFFTDHFHRRLEDRARANLTGVLERLAAR